VQSTGKKKKKREFHASITTSHHEGRGGKKKRLPKKKRGGGKKEGKKHTFRRCTEIFNYLFNELLPSPRKQGPMPERREKKGEKGGTSFCPFFLCELFLAALLLGGKKKKKKRRGKKIFWQYEFLPIAYDAKNRREFGRERGGRGEKKKKRRKRIEAIGIRPGDLVQWRKVAYLFPFCGGDMKGQIRGKRKKKRKGEGGGH